MGFIYSSPLPLYSSLYPLPLLRYAICVLFRVYYFYHADGRHFILLERNSTMPHFMDPFAGLVPEKRMNARELIRGLRLSLAAEEEATHLYETLADSTDNPLARKVLQDIADEERVHKGEFNRLIEILVEDEKKFMSDGAQEVNEMMDEVKDEYTSYQQKVTGEERISSQL